MNSKKKQLITMLLLVGLLLAGSVFVYGCKKSEPEPTVPAAPAAPAAPTAAQVEDAASQVVQAVEQTTCPVMGAAINKALFIEYKGKKVYFCCDGCQDKFKEAPEQYIAKLPQFNQ